MDAPFWLTVTDQSVQGWSSPTGKARGGGCALGAGPGRRNAGGASVTAAAGAGWEGPAWEGAAWDGPT